MKNARPTSATRYRSPLRESQAKATRERIADAVFAVFQQSGGHDDVTFKAVAEAAGVTEMTVYRHFPKREDLLGTLWQRINSELGVPLPGSVSDLLERNAQLYTAYDRLAGLILASITSAQGREMRLSRKRERQQAFSSVAADVNPRLPPKRRKQLAAILQLLQSSYAWDSLRSNWDMKPNEIAEATRAAMEALILGSKKEKS